MVKQDVRHQKVRVSRGGGGGGGDRLSLAPISKCHRLQESLGLHAPETSIIRVLVLQ